MSITFSISHISSQINIFFYFFNTQTFFHIFCPTAEGADEQLSHRYEIRRRIAPFTHIFAKSMKIVHRSYELHWRRRILFELSRQIKIASTNYKQTAVLFFSFQSVSIFLIFSTFSDIFPHRNFSSFIFPQFINFFCFSTHHVVFSFILQNSDDSHRSRV